MKVISDRHEVIYRNDYEGKAYYKIKLAKKDENGNWQNGYMTCRFRKDVELQDKSHIEIKDAWLDFYLKDKNTVPYIFINDFELSGVKQNNQEEKKDPFAEFGEQINIEDEELPF